MKRFLGYLSLLIGAILLVNACQKAASLTLNTPGEVQILANGSSGSITFSVNRAWTVSSSSPWCKVSPSSGAASDAPVTVTVTCDPNDTYEDRECTVTIKAEDLMQTVKVKQPANLDILVPSESIEVHSWFGLWSFDIEANVDYEVTTDVNWMKQGFYGSKGLTTQKIYIDIEENTSDQPRKGNILFKQKGGDLVRKIAVTQHAYEFLEVEGGYEDHDVTAPGGRVEVLVKANIAFDITMTDEWIHHVETVDNGTNHTVVLEIDPNVTLEDRRGGVTFDYKDGTEYEKYMMSGGIAFNQPIGLVAVDMGLPSGTLWASCNVGAESPDQAGGIYGWGELEPKAREDRTWTNYQWFTINKYEKQREENGVIWTTYYEDPYLTKYYVGNERWGKVDNNTVLDPEDDVAQVQMKPNKERGWNWRMPTMEEWQELMDNCYYDWVVDYRGKPVGEIYGHRLTSKINGNVLFFPNGGILEYDYDWTAGDVVIDGPWGYGFYWTSSLNTEEDGQLSCRSAHAVQLTGSYSPRPFNRIAGLNVRAVCTK